MKEFDHLKKLPKDSVKNLILRMYENLHNHYDKLQEKYALTPEMLENLTLLIAKNKKRNKVPRKC